MDSNDISNILVGDTVYVDFGDSIQTGGEITGIVEEIDSRNMIVAGRKFPVAAALFIEKIS